MDGKQQKQEAKPKTGEGQNVKAASAKEEKPAAKSTSGGGSSAKTQSQPKAATSQPKAAAPKTAAQSQTRATKENVPAARQTAQNGEATYDAAKDANDNKMMAILCYIWILVLIPLLSGAHKTSQFVKYHVNQGLVLFIFWAAYWVVIMVLQIVLIHVGLLWIYYFFWLLWLLPTIYGIIGIINAAAGKCQPLPLIGKITIIK